MWCDETCPSVNAVTGSGKRDPGRDRTGRGHALRHGRRQLQQLRALEDIQNGRWAAGSLSRPWGVTGEPRSKEVRGCAKAWGVCRASTSPGG